jgi:hypothetical protein
MVGLFLVPLSYGNSLLYFLDCYALGYFSPSGYLPYGHLLSMTASMLVMVALTLMATTIKMFDCYNFLAPLSAHSD